MTGDTIGAGTGYPSVAPESYVFVVFSFLAIVLSVLLFTVSDHPLEYYIKNLWFNLICLQIYPTLEYIKVKIKSACLNLNGDNR